MDFNDSNVKEQIISYFNNNKSEIKNYFDKLFRFSDGEKLMNWNNFMVIIFLVKFNPESID